MLLVCGSSQTRIELTTWLDSQIGLLFMGDLENGETVK
jgi:hypothetical protein